MSSSGGAGGGGSAVALRPLRRTLRAIFAVRALAVTRSACHVAVGGNRNGTCMGFHM